MTLLHNVWWQRKHGALPVFNLCLSIRTASHINTQPLQRSRGAENEQPPASQRPPKHVGGGRTRGGSYHPVQLCFIKMFGDITPCRWCDMELDGEEGCEGNETSLPACARKLCWWTYCVWVYVPPRRVLIGFIRSRDSSRYQLCACEDLAVKWRGREGACIL